MRYRKLTEDGDYSFGNGQANFYINSPEAVAQAVLTRLKLMQGEWFLDVTVGTPYATQILGYRKKTLYDTAIRRVILETQGVVSIDNYASLVKDRQLNVQCTITTIYGSTPIQTAAPF